ncbi:MAG: HigA family addiction module antidote protein, partial [Gammaproteobacteria bacterium]|nr:HigA family addiction module antidote protein [Gammaproteobacteria bacterium]
ALHVSVDDIRKLAEEKKAVNVDTALRLARYFNTTAQFWLNLQAAYDLRIVERKIGNKINHEILPLTMVQQAG